MTNVIKNAWCYDLETYPNCFTFCTVYGNGKGMRVFEVSDRKNETEEILEFMRKIEKHNHTMVGFNNLSFDYPILHYIIEKARKFSRRGTTFKLTSKELYDKAQDLIKNQFKGGFSNNVKPSDVVLRQMDLFKIHHFDNKARATSLKMIEFNMRSRNIEDLPFPVGKVLSDDEIDVLIKYNKHDVMMTLDFMNYSKEAIELRTALTQKLGFDVTNHNDAKIGSDLFVSRLEKEQKGICYSYSNGRRKIRQTKRDQIEFNDIILPYVKFHRPEFTAIRNWFEKQVITETKGVFTDLLESDLGDVAKYANLRKKRQKFKGKPSNKMIEDIKKDKPLMWVEEIPLKSGKDKFSYWWNWNVADTLNVVVDGLQYDFGTGGLHGTAGTGVYKSCDEFVYVDVDVASYYPNLSIQNELYPEHLGKYFCKVYQDLYDERKTYPKGSPENYALKIALNGSYGKSNDQYSPLYDPKFTMAITVNGQLLLCLLAEKLMDVGAKIVYLNTDGLTYRIPRKDLEISRDAYKSWEELTKLELEEVIYETMYLRDVNNFIMITDDGKIKRKGAYEYDGLDWNKNHSSLVIQKAVEHELLGRGSAEDFILNHEDEFDFMLRTKVPRSSRLVLVDDNGVESIQQNICRYYASKDGGKLIKIMPPIDKAGNKYWEHEDGSVAVSASKVEHDKLVRKGYYEIDFNFNEAISDEDFLKVMERRLSIDSEWKVKTCNNMDDFEWDIDYDYYISAARKLIDELFNETP